MPSDAREREREKLSEAHRQILICAAHMAEIAQTEPDDGEHQQAALDPAHRAIDALVRAVREATREEDVKMLRGKIRSLSAEFPEAHGTDWATLEGWAAAIEALGRDDG